jgi:hypothetical protein
MVIAVVWVALASAGCATDNKGASHGPRAENAPNNRGSVVPSNYRELVATHIKQTFTAGGIAWETAMISTPFDKSFLFRSGPIPTVCVAIDKKDFLGAPAKGYFLFSLENGQAQRLEGGNALIDTCPNFTPFTEVR